MQRFSLIEQGSMFPPGLAVRTVSVQDNEPVRSLFIAGQTELYGPESARDVRVAVKKYTDSCLSDDMARPSAHYSNRNRRMWVLESQQHEIVAMVAVDSFDNRPDTGLLRRLYVHPDFRRLGVATLLMRRAEQWSARQGYSHLRLHVSEFQPGARALCGKLQYQRRLTGAYGPIIVYEMEKELTS